MTSKSKNYCSVPQCKNYTSDNISMHSFPRDLKLANEWKNSLKIRKNLSDYMCVCSEHFTLEDFTLNTRFRKLKRLKKGVIPSQKIPKTDVCRNPNRRTNRNRNRLNAVPVVCENEPELLNSNHSLMDEAVSLCPPEGKQNYGSNTIPFHSTLDELTELATQLKLPIYDLRDNFQSDDNMTGAHMTVVRTLVACSENLLNLNSYLVSMDS